jgi:hypothetical protein
MKKLYAGLLFFSLFITSFTSCQSNKKQSVQFQDSLRALNSSDSSILTYVDGLEKLKESLEMKESPVYTKGDYSFFTTVFQKDSLPVIYIEFGDSGDYGYTEKKYYLDNSELVFYVEKSKQASSGEKPNYSFKESRIYFRNNVFLKAEERIANNEVQLNQLPFILVDEALIEKNKQNDFDRLVNTASEFGDFNLVFDRIDSLSASKQYLVMTNKNSNTYESSYLIKKPDSLIYKIKENPYAFKGKKLKVQHSKQGVNMIYKSAELSTF